MWWRIRSTEDGSQSLVVCTHTRAHTHTDTGTLPSKHLPQWISERCCDAWSKNGNDLLIYTRAAGMEVWEGVCGDTVFSLLLSAYIHSFQCIQERYSLSLKIYLRSPYEKIMQLYCMKWYIRPSFCVLVEWLRFSVPSRSNRLPVDILFCCYSCLYCWWCCFRGDRNWSGRTARFGHPGGPGRGLDHWKTLLDRQQSGSDRGSRA